MPVTGDIVGSPKDGADVVDGIVLDSKSPFAARLIGFVCAQGAVETNVYARAIIFETVSGEPRSRWGRKH